MENGEARDRNRNDCMGIGTLDDPSLSQPLIIDELLSETKYVTMSISRAVQCSG